MRLFSALIAAVVLLGYPPDLGFCSAGIPVKGRANTHSAHLNLRLSQTTTGSSAATSRKVQITSYPQFRGICSAVVIGYRKLDGPQLFPQRGNFTGECQNNAAPILFGVTHENDKNNHIGSANYDPNIVAYMGDFNFATDYGRWLDSKFYADGDSSVLTMSLDTINYRQINVTGWPLQFGHLFFGANDLSVKSTLGKSIFIEFDLRVLKDAVRPEVPSGEYSGHRIMVGMHATWDEVKPRVNKSHYMEIDLLQSDKYSASYGDPDRPLCKDISYDRCFYSIDGQYAEGRELSYQVAVGNSAIPTNTSQWTHVKIPISAILTKLRWVSPPGSWDSATLSGLYIGIESKGSAQSSIEVRNYEVYVEQ
jgi:hypothetical protein